MKQNLHIKETGSLVNLLYGNNSSEPQVGKGATILLYSDRHAYEVISVSEDKLSAEIRRCVAKRTDTNGMSEEQTYDYSELQGPAITIVYRKGSWYIKSKSIQWTPAFSKLYEEAVKRDGLAGIKAIRDEVMNEDGTYKLVKGKTVEKSNFSRINILFGKKEEYYDFTK